MRRLLLAWSVLCVAVAAVPHARAQPAGSEGEEPRRTDLVETTERRLAQIDVTVKGPREAIADLDREDFHLAVGLDSIDDFIVDNLCVLPEDEPTQEVEIVVEERAEPVPVAQPRQGPRASFLFYFDQHHLTMAGRARSIDLAQELIPDLVVDGHRGMIVSAGQDLRTFCEMTEDPAQLMQALRTLNADQRQWIPWVQQEESRIAEILEILNDPPDVSRALSVARGHQREERWRTQKALHLFSMVLGRMSELDPPKAVVYFADTMRKNAGDHYLSFFSRRVEGSEGDISGLTTFTAAHAFDRVLEEATAMGIRVFTIEARGLVSPPNIGIAAESSAGRSSPVANTQSLRDAQDSLVGMALESGGRAFLNGVRARKIAARVKDDLACVYLLSFDASHLRRNTTHRVVVRVDRPEVDIHVRGQLTVQSESRRLTSRLMAAFASPQAARPQLEVSGVVVPTGFENGRYSALVQLHVPGSPLPTASWDLGLSLISRGEVAADASGRVAVTGPGVPVVLESEMSFRPGPFRLVAVAHETTGNDVGSGEIEDDWPDPNGAAVTLGPVAVLQPAPAAILRDDVLRRDGAIGIGEGGLARTDRPTALVGIVCRAKGNKGKLRVERTLTGEENSSAPFGPMQLELGEERCAQIRDFIPAGSMSSGMFTYEIRVFAKQEEVASAARRFAAASPDEHPRARAEGPSGP
jgi:VWFA-related protein